MNRRVFVRYNYGGCLRHYNRKVEFPRRYNPSGRFVVLGKDGEPIYKRRTLPFQIQEERYKHAA